MSAVSAAESAGLKSILKKTAPIESTAEDAHHPGLPVAKTPEEKQRLATAIAHASRLEDEKKAVQNVFDAIDELAEFPDSHTAKDNTAAERFLYLVEPFHPSDYDSLIEERNAAGKCGYTLCSNSPKRSKAQSALVQSLTSSPWCSALCGKRALYIKAQLDETPAWERRAAGHSSRVTLRPDEGSATETQAVTLPVRTAQTDIARQQELAVERGETRTTSQKINLVSTDVMENTSTGPAAAPSFDDSHDSIEGYRATRTTYNINKDVLAKEKQRPSRAEGYLDLIGQSRIKVSPPG